MGQTDTQFKAFLRLLVDDLEDAVSEPIDEKKIEKLKRLIDNIHKSMED